MLELADLAMDQCENLVDHMSGIILAEYCYIKSAEGLAKPIRVCGISKDNEGRAFLIFARPEPNVKEHYAIVYVDAILALANMLKGEHEVPFNA